MSEGYVFTSATDVNDLLNQIVSQAAIHGWSQHMLTSLGGSGRRGHISKGGVTVNFASQTTIGTNPSAGDTMLNAIIPAADRDTGHSYTWYSFISGGTYAVPDVLCINASTGFDAGVNWYRQPGSDCQSDAAQNRGTFSLIRAKGAIGKVYMFFFENPSSFIVIAEVRPGEFYWLTAGMLQKDYSFGGGQFYGASLYDSNTSNSYPVNFEGIRVRYESADVVKTRGNHWGGSWLPSGAIRASFGANQRIPVSYRIPSYWIWNNGNTSFASDIQAGYDAASGRLWIHPAFAYAVRPDSTKSYTGVIPHVWFSTLDSFIGADIVTIGGQEFMIFPANWRASPYNVSIEGEGSLGVPWLRNNFFGSGFAIRKPS